MTRKVEMADSPPGVSRAATWARAVATVLPVWLHIAWLVWIVRPLGAVVSENVFGFLNALWLAPLALTLYGSLRGWVREWVVWTMVMLPYAALLCWIFLIIGD